MSAATRPVAAVDGPGELRWIPLAQLRESPWNPRKHFDATKLAETAESLKVNGQLTPIVVRPIKSKLSFSPSTDQYEIGAGHRRFRAAPIAGLTHLLAVVRLLDDVAFLELLTIENKQREDVTPLDEAAGFRLLMEKAGYDVPKLAARVGLSTKYVYDRLKLLQLVPAAKKLLEEGTITAGHAILLARLTREDQGRAMDVDEGGLFEGERVHAELELDDDETVKPRSVRELETWIHDHIRFKPDAVDPFLFPETAEQVAGATQTKLKVVHITHDWMAHSDVRHDGAKERVYGEQSWKRADGQHKSKTCAYSALGVVVSGFGQGEAFRVCVNRDRCLIHWPKRAKQAKANAKAKAEGRDPYAEQQAREQAERARENIERARWKKATPALLKALRAKCLELPLTPDGLLWRLAVKEAGPYRPRPDLAPGRSVEALVRWLVFQHIAYDVADGQWQPWAEVPETLKPFGIDAKAIVGQVAPKPVEKKAAKTPAKKKAKR